MKHRFAVEEILYANEQFDMLDDVYSREMTVVEDEELVSLDLSSLNIEFIPGELAAQLPNLRFLDVSNNEISDLPWQLLDMLINDNLEIKYSNTSISDSLVAKDNLMADREKYIKLREKAKLDEEKREKIASRFNKPCNWCGEAEGYRMEAGKIKSRYEYHWFEVNFAICNFCDHIEIFYSRKSFDWRTIL